MICELCQKQQSLFIADYPLAFHLSKHRICLDCNQKLESIKKDRNTKESQEYLAFFQEKSKKNNWPQDVKEYMDAILDPNISAIDISSQVMSQKRTQLKNMMLTSGINFEGYRIDKYIGFMSAEIGLGMGLIKSITSSFANLSGFESKGISNKLKNAKQNVTLDLMNQAFESGANAIIGVDLDYTMFGESLLGVIISGTAVIISKID